MKQKLVTIYMRRNSDSKDVEEHLQDYLDRGYRIKSLTPLIGGTGEDNGFPASGWMFVVLEKP